MRGNRKRIQEGRNRQKKGRGRERGSVAGTDYGTWKWTPAEMLSVIALYLLLDGAISLLFFRSVVAFVLFLPGILWFFQDRKKERIRHRRGRMREEFLTAMQLVGTALSAGYSAENAFREAGRELAKIYPEGSFIRTEVNTITARLRLNQTLEELLLDLGERSRLEEISSFAEVFSAARRTGGDLISIVSDTVSGMQQRQETRREIDTILAGRKMEQQMMSLIPLLILAYVDITSPGFLQVLYHNLTGILIMSVCLCVYFGAWLWGRRIMNIEV